MTARLAQIWRHPVKGIGREPLDAVTLNADAPMPGDRAWAFQHEGAPDEPGWQPRRNFLVVANGPKLAQVTAKTEETGSIALSHPDRPAFSFAPETEGAALAEWVRPLWPETAPAPRALVKAPPQGMGDNGAAEVSILSLASLRDLSSGSAAISCSTISRRGRNSTGAGRPCASAPPCSRSPGASNAAAPPRPTR